MWKPIAAISGPLACLVMLGPLATPGGAAVLPHTSDQVPVVSVDPVTSVPVAVSKSGRYVVEWTGTRLVMRDRVRDRQIKRFPAAASRTSVSISDNGRYVTYTVPYKGRIWVGDKYWNNWRRTVRVYDRRTGKTRSATTTRSGKALTPKWRSTCTSDTCDEGIPLTAAPQLDGGQISGNGRYIVFCANYIKPDRIDLYIKNWRTKSLKRINGACSFSHDSDVGWEWILPPTVSEDGQVILLPGHTTVPEDGDGCWDPSRALIRRRAWVQVGGRAPTMTHDGRLVSTVGAPSGCDDYSAAAHAVWWFDVASRTIRPADLPGLRLTMKNASRHGRYVTWFEYGDEPMDLSTGSYPGQRWVIWDRTGDVRYDLGAALRVAGYQPRPGGAWYGNGPGVDYPLMTGDGRTVFLDTDRGAVAVRWSPGP